MASSMAMWRAVDSIILCSGCGSISRSILSAALVSTAPESVRLKVCVSLRTDSTNLQDWKRRRTCESNTSECDLSRALHCSLPSGSDCAASAVPGSSTAMSGPDSSSQRHRTVGIT